MQECGFDYIHIDLIDQEDKYKDHLNSCKFKLYCYFMRRKCDLIVSTCTFAGTHRHTNRHTDTHTDKQTDKQTRRQRDTRLSQLLDYTGQTVG